jgi:protein disulfide-isomerase A6
VFGAGSKGSPEPYEGGRTASDIVQFAKDKAAENKPPPEVAELTAVDSFTTDCLEQQVEVLLFVTHQSHDHSSASLPSCPT